MSDNSTTLTAPDEAQEATAGHGRHRGSVSAQEPEATPHGRHRRPSEGADQSDSTAG